MAETLNPLFSAALRLQQFCESNEWRFCFIGGLAVQRWGQPRFTNGADLSLLTGFGDEEKFIDALLSEFKPRRVDGRDFALKYRVLLMVEESGIPLDVALGALPFEANAVERATAWTVAEGQAIKTCGPEDLIVHKAFAARNLDGGDIEGILMRQGGNLDLDLVWSELLPLIALKEEPEIETKLRKLVARSKA